MQKRGARSGFTLLEVMIATSLMAVGTMSVLVVMATAAAMASQRTGNLRVDQVVDEARHDAQTIVNAFRPGLSAPGVSKTDPKTGKPVSGVSGQLVWEPSDVTDKRSLRYTGLAYDLKFHSLDHLVPEKGYDVAITVHYGEGLTIVRNTTIASTVIPEEEFQHARTWQEEQKPSTKSKASETK